MGTRVPSLELYQICFTSRFSPSIGTSEPGPDLACLFANVIAVNGGRNVERIEAEESFRTLPSAPDSAGRAEVGQFELTGLASVRLEYFHSGANIFQISGENPSAGQERNPPGRRHFREPPRANYCAPVESDPPPEFSPWGPFQLVCRNKVLPAISPEKRATISFTMGTMGTMGTIGALGPPRATSWK